MSRRRGILLGVLLILAGAIAACGWLLLRGPVNPWAAGRINAGMTETDVQAILGRPADRAYHPWDIAVVMPSASTSTPEWEKLWFGREWVIMVHFDESGNVIKAGCGDKDFDNSPEPMSRQIWHLLGW